MSEHKESLSAQPKTTEQIETQPETTAQSSQPTPPETQTQESDESAQQTNKSGRRIVVVICVILIVAGILVLPFLFRGHKGNNKAATAPVTQTQQTVSAASEEDGTVSLPSDGTTAA